jgi:hypothetical protein
MPNGKDLQNAEKGSASKTKKRPHGNLEMRKTDLKAWLPRGLQGMLEGLAEEIVGDGRP